MAVKGIGLLVDHNCNNNKGNINIEYFTIVSSTGDAQTQPNFSNTQPTLPYCPYKHTYILNLPYPTNT